MTMGISRGILYYNIILYNVGIILREGNWARVMCVCARACVCVCVCVCEQNLVLIPKKGICAMNNMV